MTTNHDDDAFAQMPGNDPLDALLRDWHEENAERAAAQRDKLMKAFAASAKSRLREQLVSDSARHNTSSPAEGGRYAISLKGDGARASRFARLTPALAASLVFAATLGLLFNTAGRRSDARADLIMASEGGRLDAVNSKGELIGPCPLKHTDVRVDVSGSFARVTLQQRYGNPYADKIEAVYTFPLSHRAAVDRMNMTIGDRVIVGEVKEREAARATYEAAKSAGHAAALLEQERPNIFTQSVANIEPGVEIVVEISYVELLEARDGVFGFAFPMVVAPRYIPGGIDPTRPAPAGLTARDGLILLAPGTLNITANGDSPRAPIDAARIYAALDGALAIEQPASDWWTPDKVNPATGQVAVWQHFETGYLDGQREAGMLYTDGTGQINGRWFYIDPKSLAGGGQGTGFAANTNQVPDAARITPQPVKPPTRAGHDISITVNIDTGGPGITDLTSELHTIHQTYNAVRPDGTPHQVTLSLNDGATIPNQDFVLHWRQTADTITEQVFTHAGPNGNFITLILNPPERVENDQAVPRELVFVLDTSGSMQGFPIEKAKEVMSKAIAALRPQDTFNLITFAGDTHVLWDRPQPASADRLAEAQQFLASRNGSGGTEMMTAINAALEVKPVDGQPPMPQILTARELANLPADGRTVRVSVVARDLETMWDRKMADIGVPLMGMSLRLPLDGGKSIYGIPGQFNDFAGITNGEPTLRWVLDGTWQTLDGERAFVIDSAQRLDMLPPQPIRIVCFMTDGEVGNDMAIIDAVKKNAATTRVFSFGIGNSVNRYLLDGIAKAGRGAAEYVLLNENADAKVAAFTQRIQSPVLTDVRMDFSEGLEVVDRVPAELPDLYDVAPIVVHAVYLKPGKGSVTLRGNAGSGPYERTLELDLPAVQPDHDVIATLWAREKVEQIMNRDLAAAQNGTFPDDLKQQVIDLGVAYQIMTQFTSFVAVENLRVTIGGQPRLVPVPIELPEGQSWEGTMGEAVNQWADDLIVDADEASIPWHKDVCYPKNWAELACKKSPSGNVTESEANETITRKLQQTMPEVKFEGITLDLAIDYLRDMSDVNIVVDWSALETAAIEKDKEVSLNVAAGTVTIENVLKRLLEESGGGESDLAAKVGDGVLRISTKEELLGRTTVQTYNVEDLIQRVSEFEANTTLDQPAQEEVALEHQLLWEQTEKTYRSNEEKIKKAVIDYDFAQARQLMESSEKTLDANRHYAADATRYQQFHDHAIQLRRYIDEEESASSESDVAAARREIDDRESQRVASIEESKGKQIEALMRQAAELRNERRYDDAVAVLGQTLAIDPGNQQAATLKNTLDDVSAKVNQRTTAAASDNDPQDEMSESEVALIPWNKDVLYPKNWAEISAKRNQGDNSQGVEPIPGSLGGRVARSRSQGFHGTPATPPLTHERGDTLSVEDIRHLMANMEIAAPGAVLSKQGTDIFRFNYKPNHQLPEPAATSAGLPISKTPVYLGSEIQLSPSTTSGTPVGNPVTRTADASLSTRGRGGPESTYWFDVRPQAGKPMTATGTPNASTLPQPYSQPGLPPTAGTPVATQTLSQDRFLAYAGEPVVAGIAGQPFVPSNQPPSGATDVLSSIGLDMGLGERVRAVTVPTGASQNIDLNDREKVLTKDVAQASERIRLWYHTQAPQFDPSSTEGAEIKTIPDMNSAAGMDSELLRTNAAEASSLDVTCIAIDSVLLEVADDADPVELGKEMTYLLRFTNQSKSDVSDISLEVDLPEHLRPVKSSGGPARREGQRIHFLPQATIAPSERIERTLTVVPVKAGSVRIWAFASCAELKGVRVSEAEHSTFLETADGVTQLSPEAIAKIDQEWIDGTVKRDESAKVAETQHASDVAQVRPSSRRPGDTASAQLLMDQFLVRTAALARAGRFAAALAGTSVVLKTWPDEAAAKAMRDVLTNGVLTPEAVAARVCDLAAGAARRLAASAERARVMAKRLDERLLRLAVRGPASHRTHHASGGPAAVVSADPGASGHAAHAPVVLGASEANLGLVLTDAGVLVSVLVDAFGDGAIADLTTCGLAVESASKPTRVVIGRIAIDRLGDLAMCKHVRRVEGIKVQ